MYLTKEKKTRKNTKGSVFPEFWKKYEARKRTDYRDASTTQSAIILARDVIVLFSFLFYFCYNQIFFFSGIAIDDHPTLKSFCSIKLLSRSLSFSDYTCSKNALPCYFRLTFFRFLLFFFTWPSFICCTYAHLFLLSSRRRELRP